MRNSSPQVSSRTSPRNLRPTRNIRQRVDSKTSPVTIKSANSATNDSPMRLTHLPTRRLASTTSTLAEPTPVSQLLLVATPREVRPMADGLSPCGAVNRLSRQSPTQGTVGAEDAEDADS